MLYIIYVSLSLKNIASSTLSALSICLPTSCLSRYQLPIATCLPTNLPIHQCARKFPQIGPPSSISRSSSSSASKSESPSSSCWSHFDSGFLPYFGVKSSQHAPFFNKSFGEWVFQYDFKIWIWYSKWKSRKLTITHEMLRNDAISSSSLLSLLLELLLSSLVSLFTSIFTLLRATYEILMGWKLMIACHENISSWHNHYTTIYPTYSNSPAMDLPILAWVVGPFRRLHTATALLVACCSPANQCVEFSWHEVAKCKRHQTIHSFLQIEETGMS